MAETNGSSRYVILGMLAHIPLTGYQIRRWISHEYSHFWQISYGQIYPALKGLVTDRLIRRVPGREQANGRGQIVYEITDTGRQALRDWLRQTPEVEKLRYEILLKISFGDQTEPDVLLSHLGGFIARNEAALQEMNTALSLLQANRNPGDADHVFSRLTALCGVYHYTAMRDWALEAKEILMKAGVSHETKNP